MIGEFEFIKNLKSKYSLDKVGDDCAVLPKDAETDMLITADMLVENVDFRLDWTTPEFLGHKALAVSLSDIAAMVGTPKSAMLSIAISEKLWKSGFLDRFYNGFFELAAKSGVGLIGGDISRIDGPLVIDCTVIGEVTKGEAVLRSGAKAGDKLFITGFVGGAAAGLEQLKSGVRFSDSMDAPLKHVLLRQLQPLPNVKTANLLKEYDLVTAMLDLSDGFSSDLAHLANASDVGCIVDLRKLPIDPALSSLNIPENKRIDLALNGGEDFELLFATREENFSAAQDLGFHYIGEVTANVGIVELICNGETRILSPKGYRHF